MEDYIFQSSRLGFRDWRESDLDELYSINSNKEVMEFFSTSYSREETYHFIKRMQAQYARTGLSYFAVEKLENRELIGFIGLAEQFFSADFTPCVDIGWRLKPSVWNKGYATEGAKACLAHGFNKLALVQIYAIAPAVNTKSEGIMQKIGMEKIKLFEHPMLLNDPRLKTCLLYRITKEQHNKLQHQEA